MSVQAIEEYAFGSASFNRDAFSSTVTYQVTVEDGDGPDLIRRDPFFRIGKPYSFRSDSNPAMTLTGLTNVRQDPSRRTRFFVDAVFSVSTAAGGGGGGGGGGGDASNGLPPVNDDTPPTGVKLAMEIRTAFFRRRAEKAKFLGVYVQELGVRNKWSDKLAGVWDVYVGPPLNSNLKPVEPPADYDESGFVIRQKGIWVKEAYNRKIREVKNLAGSLNQNPVTLQNPAETLRFIAEPLTLRLETVYLAENYGLESWTPVEIEWTYKPSGWWEDYPDVGRVVTIGSNPVSAAGDAVAEMHADEAAIRDARGEVLSDESPLNGLGGINRKYDAQQFFNRYVLPPIVDSFPDFKPYDEAW